MRLCVSFCFLIDVTDGESPCKPIGYEAVVDAVAVVSCVVACVVVGLDVEHVWERVGSQSYSPSTTRVAHQDLCNTEQ